MDTNKDRQKKSFKENTANMNTSEKISYIWEYYKYHILLTIMAIAVVASFVVGRINHKEIVLNVNISTKGINYDTLNKLVTDSNNALIEKGDKKEVQILYNNTALGDMTIAIKQKMVAEIAAAELDILVLSKEEFEILAKQGTFVDISEFFKSNNIDSSSLKFVYSKATDIDTTEKAYGLHMESFPIYKSLNLNESEPVLAIIANTKHKDMIVKFLNLLLK
jgi:hypothetical protein